MIICKMKNFIPKIILIVFIIMFPVFAMGQQTAQNLVLQDMNYLIYFPQGYDENSDEKWPLLIFLHGAGESGNDVNKVKFIGLPHNIEEGNQYPFIIVSPQEQQTNRGWDIENLYLFYHKLIDKYPVDINRVYLTGLSMGGFGTWNFATRYPDLFAAIIPICGGSHDIGSAHNLKYIPIWCFHGDVDSVIPVERSQVIVDTLKTMGGNVKLTIYEGVGHDSWTQTYRNNEIYEWLLQHKREKNVAAELAPEILSQYAGTYSSRYDHTIRFEVKDNNLAVWYSDDYEGPTISPKSETEFFESGDDYQKRYIVFVKNSNGVVTGVRIWNTVYAKK